MTRVWEQRPPPNSEGPQRPRWLGWLNPSILGGCQAVGAGISFHRGEWKWKLPRSKGRVAWAGDSGARGSRLGLGCRLGVQKMGEGCCDV